MANARSALAGRAWLRLANRPNARTALLLTLSCPAEVYAVAWSPDGASFAAGAADGRVRIWEAATGVPVDEFRHHAGPIGVLAWSPDGRMLASGGNDGAVRLWDRREGGVRELSWHSGWVGALSWSPDGTRLASAGEDGRLPIWRVDGDEPAGVLDRERSSIYALAWSPDGGTLVVGTLTGAVRAWRLSANRADDLPSPHTRGVYSLAWSPDGLTLASGGEAGAVALHERGGREAIVLPGGHRGEVNDVAWAPDGSVLASAGRDRTVKLWDPISRARVATLAEGHTEAVISLAWSPEGGVIASAGMEGAILFREGGREEESAPDGHDERVLSVSWSSDLHSYCSGDAGVSHTDLQKGVPAVGTASVRFWASETGAALPGSKASPTPAWPVAWSRDGTVACGGGTAIQRWNRLDGRDVGAVKTDPGHGASPRSGAHAVIPRALVGNAAVTALSWSPDGSLLAAGREDGTVWLVRGRRAKQLRGEHADCVWSLSWAPGGDLLASGSWDGSAAVWDVRSRRGVELFPPRAPGAVLAVAWRPDEGALAVGGRSGIVWLWNRSTGEVLIASRPMNPIWGLAWSPDGARLGFACADRTVRVLALERNIELRAVCLSPVLAVSFSVDGGAIGAVDGGDSTANRPIPYVFEIDGL